ncbi:CPBP family intramembrane metalloprotease [Corynebacterium breve]|uniref:CPBP family intramembrane metalloprotease n=1 Tax=Corynebacterium breve TaxID=3049799 RepID=A0ABY8VEB6_9CORY|nr:CPBP family intramembrane glutamic endopeptidase [Corynebacterium breve]WIM67090.1 CPBP family intramembrane metalloprotease [Corynebacterium breve]
MATTIVVFGSALVWLLLVSEPRDWFVPVIVAAICLHALIIFTLIAVVLRREGLGLSDIGFHRPTLRLLHLTWQIPVILILLISVQGIMFVLTGIDPASYTDSPAGTSSTSPVTDMTPLTIAAAVVTVGVLVPLWEEMLFRGVIFGFLLGRGGVFTAVVASALIFALTHVAPMLFAYLFTLGIALGLLRVFHRNLWGPLLLHAGINTLVTAVSAAALA